MKKIFFLFIAGLFFFNTSFAATMAGSFAQEDFLVKRQHAQRVASQYMFVASRLGLIEGEQDIMEALTSGIKKFFRSKWTIVIGAAALGLGVKFLVEKKFKDVIDAKCNDDKDGKKHEDAYQQSYVLDWLGEFGKDKNEKNAGVVGWIYWCFERIPLYKVLTAPIQTILNNKWIDETCGVLTFASIGYMWWWLAKKRSTATQDRRAAFYNFLAHWDTYKDRVPAEMAGIFQNLFVMYSAKGGALEVDDKLLDALYVVVMAGYAEQAKLAL